MALGPRDMVRHYVEGLTDRQAAAAVRRGMDWKCALSLDLTDPGFDFTQLHDFRHRLLAHAAGQRFSILSWPPGHFAQLAPPPLLHQTVFG